MPTIWVIVSKINETRGHGDYGVAYSLAPIGAYQDEGPYHPAFSTEQAAKEYIDSLGNRRYGLVAKEIELK